MAEKIAILSIPVEEAGWLGNADVSGDSPELQLHVKRHWLLPDSVSFRVRAGLLELLAEPFAVEEIRCLVERSDEVKSALARKEYLPALDMLLGLLELNPHCREHREQRIRILMHLERYPEALDETLEALRLDPEYSVYHSLLAHCLIHEDEKAHNAVARDCLARAVALGSFDPQDYAILGAAALDEGNSLEALDWSVKALKLYPRSLHGLHLRALSLAALKRYSTATVILEDVASLIPADNREMIAEMGLPDAYIFCCEKLLDATNKFPWSKVVREIALIEVEFGWSVDLVEAQQPEAYDGSEGIPSKELEWLEEHAPGTVRIHISGNPRQKPITVLREIMRVRVEARHLQRFPARNPAEPNHLDTQLEALVRKQFTQRLTGSLPADAPDDFVPTVESVILMMAATPLEWLSTLEVLDRFPNLRHPLLFGMAQECFLLHQSIREHEEDPDDDPLSKWITALIQPYMIAKMLFLSDRSRDVLGEAWRYRHLPSWPQAVQIYDEFRHYLRLPAKKQRTDRLLVEIATIAGIIPSPRPIHTQGTFW